jgi:hypothetical protein
MTTEQNKSPPLHTPLPWKTQPLKASSFQGNGDVGNERLIGFKIDNGSIEDIVTVDCRGKRNKEVAAANADFIVRACNSHDKLMNALIRLVSAISVAEELEEIEPGLFIESLDQAHVAIAKARGQQ